MAKRGEHFSSEFKFKVALEAIREDSTIAQIASKYSVTPKSIHNWKKEFIDNGVLVFDRNKDAKEHSKEIEEKDKYIETLHKTVGELTIQKDWLKKKSEQLGIK